MRRKTVRAALALLAVVLLATACSGEIDEVQLVDGAIDDNNTTVDGPVEDPQGECNREALIGEWRSPRAAGTEPLDPNDGVDDEGGSGVVVLTVADDELNLRSADTISVYDSWLCTESEIIGVFSSGEEELVATLSEDGTVSVGQWELTKAEQ